MTPCMTCSPYHRSWRRPSPHWVTHSVLDMYDDNLKKKISNVEEEVDDEDLQTLLRWALAGGLVLVRSRPVPIQLLYQQLTHSGNFFHNAAVRTDVVMILFVLITTNRSSWSPHTLSIKDCHVLESITPAFYRVATGSLDRSVVIYDVHQATVVLRLSFPASSQSLTCNSTQDFLYAWDSTVSIHLSSNSGDENQLCYCKSYRR